MSVSAFPIERAEHNRQAWRSAHPALLAWRALLFLACAALLMAPIVAPGWAAIGYNTPPRPSAGVVNFLLAWSLLLLLWSACMASIVAACAPELPEESKAKHWTRVAALWALRFNGMLSAAFAVVMMIKTILWWMSWQ